MFEAKQLPAEATLSPFRINGAPDRTKSAGFQSAATARDQNEDLGTNL
jgi:hypothetical protein